MRRSERILGMLSLPKYESTKGLDEDLRKRSIERFKGNSTITNDEYSVTTTKSISPEIPIASAIIVNENVNSEESYPDKSPNLQCGMKSEGAGKINILSQIIIKNPGPSSSTSIDNVSQNMSFDPTADGVSSSNTFHLRELEPPNYDSSSEDKTSGSEYIPSDNSIIQNTTSDEGPSTSAIKSEIKDFATPRGRKLTKRKKKEKQEGKSHLREVPDSTTSDNIAMPPSSSTLGSECPLKKCKYSHVEITAATKDKGKRIRNKGHSCYFCQKIVQNSAKHFEVMHGKETDVAKLLAMPKNSKPRRDGFANLIRVGDFYHNSDVIATKKGELILVRRPTEEESKFVTLNDYGPCPHCLGFMLKKHLWHHIKISCTTKKRDDVDKNRHVIAESNAILNDTFGAEFSSDFVTNISSKLRDDDIGIYCKEDNLILKFGAMQFEKYGTTQCELIRQSMRQLARFTLKLQEIENSKNCLSDYLVPQKFDTIIQATKSLCVSHQNAVRRPEFEIPSLALKIGYALKKCAAIKRGTCLRAGNLSGNETLMCFLNLMELEWSIRISSSALATMYNKKINATQLLPLTSDLIKLSLYIDTEMAKSRESLAECVSTQKWTLLATLTLRKVILFNKRRSGEASRMTICDYSSRPLWSEQCTEELKKSLTDFERKLADQLTVVEIVGKRGRKVPVLLTQDAKFSIDKLIQTRDTADVSKQNPFVFARTGSSVMSMRGHDCLRKICSDACLEHAENITSTKLRKYIATVCQVFNLSENEYDWLARHLGHDVRVHREYYRLHESAVELTKVSRLLIAVDKGEVNKFAGKKLEDINLEDMPNVEDESDSEEETNEALETDIQRERVNSNNNRPSTTLAQSPALSLVQVAPREAQSRSTKTNRRRPWSSDEKEAVLKFFKCSIKRGVVPGKVDCTKCIEKNSVLSLRTWTDVKFCVKNHLDKIKKMKK